jgi:predicted ferric reductase
MDSHLAWYTARSAGLVAWGLSAATVATGLVQAGRALRRRGGPAWVAAFHRYLGTLTVLFVVVHVASLLFDRFAGFGLAELLVPFRAEWKPVPLAWGIVAFYLIVTVQLTSWARSSMPRWLWRWIHGLSFPLFAAATAHGYQAGTDRANHVVDGLFVAGAVLVAATLALRLAKVNEPLPAAS